MSKTLLGLTELDSPECKTGSPKEEPSAHHCPPQVDSRQLKKVISSFIAFLFISRTFASLTMSRTYIFPEEKPREARDQGIDADDLTGRGLADALLCSLSESNSVLTNFQFHDECLLRGLKYELTTGGKNGTMREKMANARSLMKPQ